MGKWAHEAFVGSLRFQNVCLCLNSECLEAVEEGLNISGIVSIEEALKKCIREIQNKNLESYTIYPYEEYDNIENLTSREESAINDLFEMYKKDKIKIILKDYAIMIEQNFMPNGEQRKFKSYCIIITCQQIQQSVEDQKEQQKN